MAGMSNHSTAHHENHENPPLPNDYDLNDVLAEDAAAEKCGRSKYWLAGLRKETIRAGEFFPARKIGNRWFYFGRELAAWIAQRGGQVHHAQPKEIHQVADLPESATDSATNSGETSAMLTPILPRTVLNQRLRMELETRLRMLEREHVARVIATIQEFVARSGPES